jgi:hypothetical protein
MKQIFTRTQAVSVLVQIKNKTKDINIMAPVDSKHNLFKLTNSELFSRLSKHIDSDEIADVVDEPKFA